MKKLTKKTLQNWIDEVATEDWKYYKNELKDNNVKSKKDYIKSSYDLEASTDYENILWSAGYISALKAVLENIYEKETNLERSKKRNKKKRSTKENGIR